MIKYKSPNEGEFTYNLEESQKPYKCPVCNGVGYVPHGFYTAIGCGRFRCILNSPEICKVCNSKGIVWG